MDTKDIQKATDSTKRLIQDDHYYKYIFKKTERIVSVVFYILNSVPNSPKTESHIEDIQHQARSLHDSILQSLETRMYAAEDVVRGVAHALVSLQSKLAVAQVSGVITPPVLTVFENEIDTVLRGMNKYLNDENDSLLFNESAKVAPATPAYQSQTPVPKVTQQATQNPSVHPDRRERIRVILEAKGEASIKDISDIITDVSEKTIQRELNAMIDDNVVKRHGERRWSRYSAF